MKSSFQDLKRRQIDEKLAKWRMMDLPHRPPSGWIKAIREALGMPRIYLAKQIGVVPSTVLRLEISESDNTITLSSLQRAAEALGCELQYALVPKQSLQEILESRAKKLANTMMNNVTHTMVLEDQAVRPEMTKLQTQNLVENLLKRPKHTLWD